MKNLSLTHLNIWLLLIEALSFVLFGILSLWIFGPWPGSGRLLYALIFFADAAAFGLCAFLLSRQPRTGYTASLTVLTLNALGMFLDQMGWIDWSVLLILLLQLGLMLYGRKHLPEG